MPEEGEKLTMYSQNILIFIAKKLYMNKSVFLGNVLTCTMLQRNIQNGLSAQQKNIYNAHTHAYICIYVCREVSISDGITWNFYSDTLFPFYR